MLNKITVIVKKETLSFAKFEKLYNEDVDNIKSARFVMPKLGGKGLGKMLVTYKKPLLRHEAA